MVPNVHRNHKVFRDGGKGGKGLRKWGKTEAGGMYTYRYIAVTTTENDPCMKMGNDESHFNVSLIIVRD